MFKRSWLAAVTGIVFIATSAVFPGGTYAATANYTTKGANPSVPVTADIEHQQFARGRGGGGSRGRGARPAKRPSGNSGRNTNVNRNKNKNVNRNVNINRNVNVNVNVRHRGHGWRGARWGAVVFGVTMGTIIVVAANTPPYPPDPSLCWTWSNASMTRGYWYYCNGL